MADVTYKDALIQEVETSRLEKLRGSLARTIFGYALLALCGLQYVTAGPVRDGGPSFFIFLSGCAAFATLLGYTPRMFRQLSVIANAPICAKTAINAF